MNGFDDFKSFASITAILVISLFITSHFTRKTMKRYDIKFMNISNIFNF